MRSITDHLKHEIARARAEDETEWTDAVNLSVEQAKRLLQVVDSLSNAHDCLIRHKHDFEKRDREYVEDVLVDANYALYCVNYKGEPFLPKP